MGSGCGSVGRVVDSDTRGARFKSSHCQKFRYIEHLFTVNCVLKRRKNKEKEAGKGPFFKKNPKKRKIVSSHLFIHFLGGDNLTVRPDLFILFTLPWALGIRVNDLPLPFAVDLAPFPHGPVGPRQLCRASVGSVLIVSRNLYCTVWPVCGRKSRTSNQASAVGHFLAMTVSIDLVLFY